MKRILLFFCLIFWGVTVSLVQAKEYRIAVLPFEIHAAKDLSYVREGIQDMLSTRLFVPGKVSVIDEVEVNKVLVQVKGPLTEAKIREIGQKLGADYVLYGSLTTFGQRTSLDAKLIPVKEDKPPLALYADTNSLDELIPRLSDFAVRAVSYIEGRPVRLASAVPASPPPSAVPKAPAPTVSMAPTPPPVTPPPVATTSQPPAPPTNPNKVHPERLFREQAPPAVSQPAQVASAAPTKKENEVRASRYKYSDIDPWPDYPPDEEEDLAPVVEEPAKPEKPKKKKKHFWSKLLPWNWFGGKKEEEVIINPKEVTPPPPPPETQAKGTTPSPTTTAPAPPSNPAPTPPPSGGSWQWY